MPGNHKQGYRMTNKNPGADKSISHTSATAFENSNDEFPLRLSEGEIHYLWCFIMEGSIMRPETRHHLRQSWGFCERHAWGWLTMECSLRLHYLHGPAILYEDIMERARAVFTRRLDFVALQRRLQNREQCLMCDMGYGPQSIGYPNKETLKHGRDFTNLRSFASETRRYWQKHVCKLCTGKQDGGLLCRPHLLSELSYRRLNRKAIDMQKHFAVNYLSEQVRIYARSFIWERRNTRTAEGEASLIAAIGWCCGWAELLKIID
jgi:hypothetical protein